MKKIIFIVLISSILSIANTQAEIDCNQFNNLSKKFLDCKAKNLKKKTIGFKNKMIENANESKEKIDKSSLKEKLVKFKNSKTLTQFTEK